MRAVNVFDAIQHGNRKPLWQYMGTTFETNISVSDGLKEIGGDFTVLKSPMKFIADDENGKRLFSVPDKYCLTRALNPNEYAFFGSCGSSYEIIQRTEFANMLDDLTLRWPLETMGFTGQGKLMFVVLNAGSMDINGDPINLYFMITDVIDGKTSAKCVFTPIRLHCTNALVSGIKAAVVNAAITHRQHLQRDVTYTIGLASKMATAQVKTIEAFQSMADTVVTAEQAMRIFEAAYPDPVSPSKAGILDLVDEQDTNLSDIYQEGLDAVKTHARRIDNAEYMRDLASELFVKLSDEHKSIAGTAYAAYNAVVELADWRKGSESASEDALFGKRAFEKKRAFAEALRY